MTMPYEYTRALRWGWECLWELHIATDVPQGIQEQAFELLKTYPSPIEIHKWVEMGVDAFGSQILAHEEVLSSSKAPVTVERPLVTRSQYVTAITESGMLFWNLQGNKDLPEDFRRQLPYILRHFPLAALGGSSADWIVPRIIK